MDQYWSDAKKKKDYEDALDENCDAPTQANSAATSAKSSYSEFDQNKTTRTSRLNLAFKKKLSILKE